MKSAAIIYARTNSKRFPEKCFAPLGAPCLPLAHWVVLRSEALDVDSLVFATTDKKSDDKLVSSIEDLCISNLIVFRGSENNLVQRTIDCLREVGIKNFVRINGDSPFYPVNEINQALSLVKKNPDCKFVTNLKDRSYPYGVAIEVMNADFYIKNASAAINYEIEHPTLHLYRVASDQAISISNVINQKTTSLTIDSKEDFENLNSIILNRKLHFASDWRSAL